MLKSLTVASALLSVIERKGLSPTLMTLKDELVSFHYYYYFVFFC